MCLLVVLHDLLQLCPALVGLVLVDAVREVDDELAVFGNTCLHNSDLLILIVFNKSAFYSEAEQAKPATCGKTVTARTPGGRLRRGAEHLFRLQCLALGDVCTHIADEGAVAAGAAHRLRCHVGAVGLQHDGVQRQGVDGLGCALGTVEGAGTAKANDNPCTASCTASSALPE